MNRNLTRKIVYIVLLGIALALMCGCNAKSQQETPTVTFGHTLAPLATASAATPTPDIEQNPTATAIPETPTPTATFTPSPSPTVSPTVSPTPSPTPKINPQKVIERGNTSKKNMAVIVNVSWGEDRLVRILEIFDKYNIKATFLVSGKFAESAPKETRLIIEKGHEIGTHGYDDMLNPEESTQEAVEADLKKSIDAIYKVTGQRVTYFMPAYEAMLYYMPEISEKNDCKLLYFSLDTIDWKGDARAREIIERVSSQFANGVFILSHPTVVMYDVWPELIANATAKGYTLTTVSECLK